MSDVKVSVALCTFNGSEFLEEQLGTIASQNRPPDELVVCDDLSTDNTLSILKDFASKSRFPVRIFSNPERLGPAKNFAKAIEACDGDVIVLCDQDDKWRTNKIESLLTALDRNPTAIFAFSNAAMVDEHGQPLGQTLWEAVRVGEKLDQAGRVPLQTLLRYNVIPGASMAFRAAFRNMVLPLPSGWMHDYWIVLLGSVFGYGVPVEDVLFDYRRHARQVCGWRKKTFLQVCLDSFKTDPQESWKKLEAFRHLRARILAAGDSDQAAREKLALVVEKETHLERRAHARQARGPVKVTRVLAETLTGRYQRFSDSWYSVIRDL